MNYFENVCSLTKNVPIKKPPARKRSGFKIFCWKYYFPPGVF